MTSRFIVSRLVCAMAAVVVLSGCLNVSTVVRVAPDGSGTIEQTLMFNPRNIEQALAGMGFKPTSAAQASGGKAPVIDEAGVRRSVGAMGEGVRVMSISPVTLADGFQGVRAKFAFSDITKLNSEELLMPGPARQEISGGREIGNAVTFALRRTPQGTSILTMTLDQGKDKPTKIGKTGAPKAGKTGPGLDDADGQQMLKTMLKGFRIGMDVEVTGQIVATDADYVVGPRITLLEIDLESLVKDPKKLDSLDKLLGPDPSLEKARPYLKDVKGLKINRPVVSVEFR